MGGPEQAGGAAVTIDLTGTDIGKITTPLGQDCVIDLGPFTDSTGAPVTVTSWTWLGQVHRWLGTVAASLAADAVAEAAFTASTDGTRRLATITADDIATMGAGRFVLGVKQLTPTDRQVAYTTKLTVVAAATAE